MNKKVKRGIEAEFKVSKPSTLFIDLDGTLLKHAHAYSNIDEDQPLNQHVINKLDYWDSLNHKIILVSARKESARSVTESILEKNKVPYDALILGLTSGKRYIVNDKLHVDDDDRAVAINVITDNGFKGLYLQEEKKMNILIPMAGLGSRFEKVGYTFPKPLIDVAGTPMIERVVKSLSFEGHFIFLVQKEHNEKYNLKSMLNVIAPNCSVIEVDGLTEGAACTTLLAKELINKDEPLLISNCDQILDWDTEAFSEYIETTKGDGVVVCFPDTHPKWSFARCDDQDVISEVAEKKPISNQATAGIYFWKRGSDYVKYAEQMIEKDLRFNNEFYVCPVYNEAIQDSKVIYNYRIKKQQMKGLGTPEDLQYFLQTHDL